MPPVQAIAALRIFEAASDKDETKEWLEVMYPKILAMHEYLYRERDPLKVGLVYIRHPWESGLDNSPTWDDPLKAMKIDKDKLPSYERKDLKKGIPPNFTIRTLSPKTPNSFSYSAPCNSTSESFVKSRTSV